jgi:transglutaminase-like putative cysteine protease
LPVAACFVVTDSVPDTIYLVLFLTAMVLLMLTSATRQKDRVHGRRLMAMALVPVFVAVGFLFLSVPEQTYYHQEKARAISDFLVGKYTLEQMMDRLAGKTVPLEQKKVDLSAVGARIENNTKILEVTTRYNSGALYLRASSLDRYTGRQWLDSQTQLPNLYWPEPADGIAYHSDEVVIKTQFAHEMLYLPYYATSLDLTGITRGYRNTKKLNEYSITQTFLNQPDVYFGADRNITPDQQVDIAAATRLSEETKKWAIPLAQQIVGDLEDPYYQALSIGEFVKNSARYDTKTGRMSAEYTDFAQWFLEQSETGYCIHFATAGAVLLKALGIPARYVTGYLVNTQVGTTTEVLGTHAHAWVEYWLPGFGWRVLECTPPAEDTADTPEATHSATTPQHTDTTIPALTPDLAPQTPGGHTSGEKLPLWWLLVLLIPLGLWLQGLLRRKRRVKRCTGGTPNQNALACWIEAEKLSRHLGETPPEHLRTLAEKAKFSPYTLTDEELNDFYTYLNRCVQRLKKKRLLTRLWQKWILTLY